MAPETHSQRHRTCTHEALTATAQRGDAQNSCAGAAHVVGVHLGQRKFHFDLGNGTAVDGSEDSLQWDLNMPQYVLLSHAAQAHCSVLMAGIAFMILCPKMFVLEANFSSIRRSNLC